MDSNDGNGSVRARLEWYKRVILPYEGSLRSRLRRVLPDGADVDDVVAEAMTRAYATADIAQVRSGRAYLYQIARNLAIDSARRNKIVSFEVIADIDLIRIDNSTQASLEARDELRHLQAMLDTLPPKCRRAFVLRRVYDRPTSEIAKEMGLSVSTVDKHLAHAAVKIMHAIGEYQGSGFGWSLNKRDSATGDRRGSSAIVPTGACQ
ncbi:sigma-70 family RNA polymerase sigma factor [Sphingomonas aliaeris]|uniref:Sigma-70 family RNA polymerase sigma factor n=1 Tax=Sphingomonas aliaeris TaxID=2759526 RepID=A0A974NVA1_9SPHN|nr:sigma-70 family RNA polymerase sigma factor [Sphingomonas aliaeris]QQV77378.1 sigma-70 family RNA polymerase sigma factor [Sphingomonas aliaeris]